MPATCYVIIYFSDPIQHFGFGCMEIRNVTEFSLDIYDDRDISRHLQVTCISIYR